MYLGLIEADHVYKVASEEGVEFLCGVHLKRANQIRWLYNFAWVAKEKHECEACKFAQELNAKIMNKLKEDIG